MEQRRAILEADLQLSPIRTPLLICVIYLLDCRQCSTSHRHRQSRSPTPRAKGRIDQSRSLCAGEWTEIGIGLITTIVLRTVNEREQDRDRGTPPLRKSPSSTLRVERPGSFVFLMNLCSHASNLRVGTSAAVDLQSSPYCIVNVGCSSLLSVSILRLNSARRSLTSSRTGTENYIEFRKVYP